jgi:lipopolysaccharide heptosyltransferase II
VIPLDPGRTGRILIRANNWIGDVVMISPAVRAIREHFAAARIAIVAKRWVLEALSGNPHFDDLIEYDPGGPHAGPGGRLHLARELRRDGPIDLAVLFQKAFDAAVIARLAGARIRVGYATDFRSGLLTHPLPLPPPGTHHVELFLGLARALGCEIRDPNPYFHLGREDRVRAAARIAASPLAGPGPRIAIHPAASKAPRAWHSDRFARVAGGLIAAVGARTLLVGGPADTVVLDGIASVLPSGSCFIPGPATPLRELAGLLESCDLFIGNDSGPMHVAAALGIATVGIFGPGWPRTTGPIGRPGRVAAIGKSYPCSPCRQDFFRECPPAPSGKPFCLEEIGVEEVMATALALLPTRTRTGI